MSAPTHAPRQSDPYTAMLRGAAVPALAIAAVALAVFAVRDGWAGVAGVAAATAVVVVSFSTSILVLRRTAGHDPRVAFLAAMVAYMTTVMVLGLGVLPFRDVDWLSATAFALTAVTVSLAWTTGQVVAFTKVRSLVYDTPDTAS